MKRYFAFLCAILCAVASLRAQSLPLACTEAGTELEYAEYDADGTLTGYTQTVVEECVPVAEGLLVTNRVTKLDAERRPLDDGAGDALHRGRITVGPEGMFLRLDEWLGTISGDDWKATIECQGDDYLIPYALHAGQMLPELAMTMIVRTESGFRTKMAFRIFDREVVAEERLAVPAGCFETVCLSETIRAKWSVIGMTVQIREWYAPGIGSVRTEQRNKRGKLESYSELVSVTPPQR